MTQGWRTRLETALKDKGISKRAASLAAKQGPGYVHSILREGKDPSVDNLAAVCAAAGISLHYVLFGFDASPEATRLLQIIEADPERRDALLKLLADRQQG